MKNIMILDGHSIAFRAYHAIPELTTAGGITTNAIYGFVNMLVKIISEFEPNDVYVAFDLHHPTFRHDMYKDYKAGRNATPETLISQIELIKNLLTAMNIHVVTSKGYEADDILGTLSLKANEEGVFAYLVTGDRDSLQLIGENTNVLYTKKGVSSIVKFDLAEFENEYGILPGQFVDCKALMGDSSDNIPGVPGIGQKTAVALLKEYNTLDGIYENIDNVKSQSTKNKLIAAKESAYMSRTLAQIVRNAPVELECVPDSKYEMQINAELRELLEKLEMNKLLASLKSKSADNGDDAEEQNDTRSLCADFDFAADDVIKEIQNCGEVSVFTDGVSAVSKGCLIWTKTNVYSSALDAKGLLSELKPVLESENVVKCLQDVKSTMHMCDSIGINMKNVQFDYSVAAYLLDAVSWRRDIDYMAVKYIGDDWKKNINCLTGLRHAIEVRLEAEEMLSLYNDMEYPLIEILYSMEKEGCTVDINMLKTLGNDYDNRIETLRNSIYEFAGEEFNINSPKQLGEVLFVKLGLPVVKKTRTGYSTDSEVLEQLQNVHPIIDMIVNYRQLVKLKTTYVDGLIAAADADGRVHTTFNQTITNTGRLSSTDPNLQNIPIRTEEGTQIRNAFITKSDEYVLVDADYSQIELRMFAHMSGDETFINAFVNGEDIHRKTASDVFKIPYDNVTPLMRSHAKAVNFGIIYGISDFGLSKNLSISKSEAKDIINNYLAQYPTIGKYMEDSKAFARENEYSKTIFNRRRYCPDIHSKNFLVRSGAERIAINMPVQGSAADIIKLAMINVYNELKNGGYRSKLILQVHDELVVEAHVDEVESVKDILKRCMENAVKLSVPLVADIGSGTNWNDAK